MRFLSDKLRYYWIRTKRFCIHNILHADDPPHRLALGIAVGLFVAFLPLIGIQMGLAFGMAWLVRANKAVAVTLVWISNPVTMVPVYYPGYWLGCRILDVPTGGRWIELMQSNENASVKMRAFIDNLQDFAGPLFLGTFILAAIIGLISYYVSLGMIRSYRLRRWGQLLPPSLTPKNSETDDLPDLNSDLIDPRESLGSLERPGNLDKLRSPENAA